MRSRNLGLKKLQMKAQIPTRLCLPDSLGIWLTNTCSIAYISADDKYCHVSALGLRKAVFCSLKYISERLSVPPFYQIHKSYIVNLDHASQIKRQQNWSIMMDDGTELPIAKSRRKGLLAALDHYNTPPQSVTKNMSLLLAVKGQVG
jgi:DNA-binding LytR/AlgR family response regulator